MNGNRSYKRIYAFIIAISAIIGLFFVFYGYEETFSLWEVSTLSPEFADLRTITGGAETLAEGIDPYIENPNDPWHRQMNYPRVWLLLAYLGIDQSDTIYIGIVLISLFYIGLLIFYNLKLNNYEILLCLLAVFSPSVMLSIERGNNDMLIFFLVTLAIYFISQRKNYSAIISFILIVFGFILKLFPIFTVIIFIKERSFFRYVLLIFIIAIAYSILTYNDLLLIFQNTPKDPYSSYGMNVLWQAAIPLSETLSFAFRAISYLLIFASIFLFRYGLKFAYSHHENITTMTEAGFLAGTAIYVGTFIIGSNFDYRLIFLLFTIPMLFDLSGNQNKTVSLISKFSILLVLLSLWHIFISEKIHALTGRSFPGLILDEIFNWFLFFTFSFLLGLLLQEKIKSNYILRRIMRL